MLGEIGDIRANELGRMRLDWKIDLPCFGQSRIGPIGADVDQTWPDVRLARDRPRDVFEYMARPRRFEQWDGSDQEFGVLDQIWDGFGRFRAGFGK